VVRSVQLWYAVSPGQGGDQLRWVVLTGEVDPVDRVVGRVFGAPPPGHGDRARGVAVRRDDYAVDTATQIYLECVEIPK
jgi:hypothetical protein